MPKQVIVFHMRGCEPCRDYLPRFEKVAQPYQSRLRFCKVDITKSDRRVQEAAINFKVDGTPTTLVLDENDKILKRKVGNISNAEIEKLLKFAAS
jgi:thiol-disulfide isomerase/thioredoxin